MEAKFDALVRNDTWTLMELPLDKDMIGTKWIYKTKYKSDGSIDKHKVRLVAKGYAQQEGIDYIETFTPVAKMDTSRTVLVLAAQHGWIIYQMDVKSAFLNGYVDEEIYVEKPQGFEIVGKENKVYKWKKSLYGLKQAPRAWCLRINTYFQQKGFQKSSSDPNLYIKVIGSNILIVSLYVDDLIYTGNNHHMLHDFKVDMCKEFEMSDLGQLHYFLGIIIWQSGKEIFMSQEKYAMDILKKFNMSDCKPLATPVEFGLKLSKYEYSDSVDATLYRKLIGSLVYLTSTRHDIAYAVSLVSRFMADPKIEHWKTTKRILRYIRGTRDYGLQYKRTINFRLIGYTNEDWAGDIDDRKSTSGFNFSLGTSVIAWRIKKKPTVYLSTAEAEYKAATTTACEAIWLRRILSDLHEEQEGPTKKFCDNQSTIQMTKNPVLHGRTKHIELQHHFIRELFHK
eukprot:Gb_30477 [translate_table: standard]